MEKHSNNGSKNGKLGIAHLIEEARVEEAHFRSLLPDDGLIGDYMRYTDRQESPGSYHFWCLITVLASVLERRAWISRGMYNLYPNIYAMLVAPSGRCRKSRAVSLAAELIEGFDWINILADKTSPESLLEGMMFGVKNLGKDADDPTKININLNSSGLLIASELADFINKSQYLTGMVPLLTKLYDCPNYYAYTTRSKRKIELNNACLNMLGASTPSWLASELPASSFEGGFMSRMLFIVRHYRDRSIDWPEEPHTDEKKRLINSLITIRKHFRGPVTLTNAGRRWFKAYYAKMHFETEEDPAMSGFYERKPEIILKVALLLQAAKNPHVREIPVKYLDTARSIVEVTQENMFMAFAEVDLTETGRLKTKVLELTKEYGEINRRDVLRKLGGKLHSVNQLKDIECILEDSGEISVVHIAASSGRGRAATVYQYTGGDKDVDDPDEDGASTVYGGESPGDRGTVPDEETARSESVRP